ncbi:YbfB/YjiJ family MFS transporter, partial [Salmonella enterica]|uniref:YbfB/YjiJ family MFS transporter n=1 Tax=Salmonella enterica TaxID=28901 RepID=UPI00398C5614
RANYVGSLAGSLLLSFGLFHLPSRLRPVVLAWAVATGILILAMAILPQPVVVMLVRFLSGVASAGMMIFGSMIVLHHTRHPFVIAALFSGVGAGIALGNEYDIGGLLYALSANSLWLGAGALAGIWLLFVARL